MSHITDIKLRIRDLDAAEEAGLKCGLELRRNQTTYDVYYSKGTCDHALALPNAVRGQDYEIGLVKAADGDGYDVKWDPFNQRRLIAAVGDTNANKFRREYAAAVAMRRAKTQLSRKGFSVQRQDLDGGRIRLRLVRR